MLEKKSKKLYDERIEKESNKPTALMFYVTTIMLVICLLVKVICQLPIQVYVLEIACLLISIIYTIVRKFQNGILFLKEKDETLVAINNKILAKAFMIDFWMLITGELVFIVVLQEYFWWATMYIVTWLIPSLVISILSLTKGWLVWGNKKQEQTGIKEFRKRVVIGSLFFGIFVGFPHLYSNGVFHPEGIIWVLGLGASWGVMFYFAMLGIIKISEKKADKLAQEAEVDYFEE